MPSVRSDPSVSARLPSRTYLASTDVFDRRSRASYLRQIWLHRIEQVDTELDARCFRDCDRSVRLLSLIASSAHCPTLLVILLVIFAAQILVGHVRATFDRTCLQECPRKM
jgi:hypothetical protein